MPARPLRGGTLGSVAVEPSAMPGTSLAIFVCRDLAALAGSRRLGRTAGESMLGVCA